MFCAFLRRHGPDSNENQSNKNTKGAKEGYSISLVWVAWPVFSINYV